MKVKGKSIFKGHVSFDEPIEVAEYEIREWKCQLCGEWITMVLVENMVLLGGGCYSSDINREYCDKCLDIKLKIDKQKERIWEE